MDHLAAPGHESETCGSTPEAWRFDCYPEKGVVVTRELCEARNCCFIPASSGKNGVPWCFYPPGFPTYSVASMDDTALGEKVRLVKEVRTYYPGDILALDLEIRHETETRLRVRVSRALIQLLPV